MMPRLESSERIARAQDIALGNGTLEDEVARQLTESLAAMARGPRRVKAATRRDIAGMGIGLRVSPAKADEQNG